MERQEIGRNEARTGKLTALIARVREKSNPQEFTALSGETRPDPRGLGQGIIGCPGFHTFYIFSPL